MVGVWKIRDPVKVNMYRERKFIFNRDYNWAGPHRSIPLEIDDQQYFEMNKI